MQVEYEDRPPAESSAAAHSDEEREEAEDVEIADGEYLRNHAARIFAPYQSRRAGPMLPFAPVRIWDGR